MYIVGLAQAHPNKAIYLLYSLTYQMIDYYTVYPYHLIIYIIILSCLSQSETLNR